MNAPIRKAVIPAAGFGTRFLPASKAIPKEMLPLVDKPVIQYVVEEAVASGITDILIVIGRTKRTIEEHFDRHPELERTLADRGRQADLELVRSVSQMANVHFVWQHEQRGLGDAVACARAHVGNEPFAVLLGDTVTVSPEPVTAQLMRVYEQQGGSVVGVESEETAELHRFGVVDGRELSPGLLAVKDFVEKPPANTAPSNLIISGRYIFTPDLFEHLAKTPRGVGGELQLTDAMRLLVKSRPMFAWHYAGKRFDIGNKLDFVLTNLTFALQREDLRAPLVAHLRALLRELPGE